MACFPVLVFSSVTGEHKPLTTMRTRCIVWLGKVIRTHHLVAEFTRLKMDYWPRCFILHMPSCAYSSTWWNSPRDLTFIIPGPAWNTYVPLYIDIGLPSESVCLHIWRLFACKSISCKMQYRRIYEPNVSGLGFKFGYASLKRWPHSARSLSYISPLIAGGGKRRALYPTRSLRGYFRKGSKAVLPIFVRGGASKLGVIFLRMKLWHSQQIHLWDIRSILLAMLA